MKTAIIASLVASAAAFAPAQNARSSSALSESPFAKEIGAQMPVCYFVSSHLVTFERQFLETVDLTFYSTPFTLLCSWVSLIP